ncbi:hypothetical protein SAMN04488556_4026 [Halostagnicola kamekurae]|uniref:Uncharacterized protein n=1 Tax=Halostagnicola kamekurae TaxID=619731 RepID=A0A1I6UQP5_9EURY|nr:hypothetical protein SAMN04488556_4026 [Halostagnicola kamekurae]
MTRNTVNKLASIIVTDVLGLLWVASINAFENSRETLTRWMIPHDIGHRNPERRCNNPFSDSY